MSDKKKMLWAGDSPGGNYTADIAKLNDALTAAGATGVHEVTIVHDDWCALLKHRRPCNCSPEILVHPQGPKQ